MTARAGMHFPASERQLRTWFADDVACLDYLDWLRWERGFRCPRCDGTRGWRLPDGRRSCATCGRRASPTAGTVLHRTRTPLTGWFTAAWDLTARCGTTAAALQRRLGSGSYQTAWSLLHRYRAAMAPRPGERLTGVVEVDRARLAGVGAGRGGRRPVVLVAVERPDRARGAVRLLVVPDGRARTVRAALPAAVHPDAEVRVPAGRPALAAGAAGAGLRVGATPAGAEPARVAAAAGCWLRGPLQGAVEAGHLQAYLDEAGFRASGSEAHGARFHRLLERAVTTPPIRYADLVAAPPAEGGRVSPTPPAGRRQPPSRPALAPAGDRPWRTG